MITGETVGIIGASGDLGSRLVLQARSAYDAVYTFDVNADISQLGAKKGIDAAIKPGSVGGRAVALDTMTGVLESCAVVHWCAPISTLEEVSALSVGSMLVLHDSVMRNSVVAAERLAHDPNVYGRIAVVHCLMNEERTVAVASDMPTSEEAYQHMRQLGLLPQQLSAEEHDYIMAHSQAPFAMIIKALGDMLLKYDERGLLTPSAKLLKNAMEDRASVWTESTLVTILSNPELREFVGALEALLTSPPELPASRLDIMH